MITIILSTLWLIRQKIDCRVTALLRYSQLIPCSPPALPPIHTRRPGLRKRAHPFTLPLKDDKQCIPRVLYIEPCFLLSSPRFVFPIYFSLYLTLFPQQLSQSRSFFIQCSWLPSTRVNCIIVILY